jgi:hypothetical protein
MKRVFVTRYFMMLKYWGVTKASEPSSKHSFLYNMDGIKYGGEPCSAERVTYIDSKFL